MTALQAALHPSAQARGFAPAAPGTPGPAAPALHPSSERERSTPAPSRAPAAKVLGAGDCAEAAPGAAVPRQLLLGAPPAARAPETLVGARRVRAAAAPLGGEQCRVPDVVAELLRDLTATCQALGVTAEMLAAAPAAPPPPLRCQPLPDGGRGALAAARATSTSAGRTGAGAGAHIAVDTLHATLHGTLRAPVALAAAALLPRPVRPLLAGVPAEGLRGALELLLDSALQRSPRGGRLEVACAEAPSGGVHVHITDSGDFSMGARMRAALRGGRSGALPDADARGSAAAVPEGGGCGDARGASGDVLPDADARSGNDGPLFGGMAGGGDGGGTPEGLVGRVGGGAGAHRG